MPLSASDGDDFVERLNELGAQGWELIPIAPSVSAEARVTYYLRRQIDDSYRDLPVVRLT